MMILESALLINITGNEVISSLNFIVPAPRFVAPPAIEYLTCSTLIDAGNNKLFDSPKVGLSTSKSQDHLGRPTSLRVEYADDRSNATYL